MSSFLVLLAVTAVVYVPRRREPGSWFEFGPFSVQYGRFLLYAMDFFFSARVSRLANFDRGLLGADGQLAKRSWAWIIPALVPYCLMWVLIYISGARYGSSAFNLCVRSAFAKSGPK